MIDTIVFLYCCCRLGIFHCSFDNSIENINAMKRAIVQFSGGKDSTASLIYTLRTIDKNALAVFCDTGNEAAETYDYIDYVVDKLGVELKIIRNKNNETLHDVIRRKRIMPSGQKRFCTEELKQKPFIDWLIDEWKDDALIIQGIRNLESKKRSKMPRNCQMFQYYIQPVGKDNRGRNRYHNYRKQDVLSHIKKYDDSILRPVITWTGQEVIDYIIDNGLEPNPLYKKGFERVGCFPCIFSKSSDILNIATMSPDTIAELAELENDIGSRFLASNKLPKHEQQLMKSGTVEELVDYMKRADNTIGMFEDQEDRSCMSYYGLCE